MRSHTSRVALLSAFALLPFALYGAACGGGGQEKGTDAAVPPGGTATGTGTLPDGGVFTNTPGDVAPPTAVDAPAANPPAGVTFPPAPAFGDKLKYEANRSSVMLYLPAVDGARDYRVFAIVDGVKVDVTASGGEDVAGATITCAGLRQHNQCDDSESMTQYGKGAFYIGTCYEDARSAVVQKTVLRQIEINKLSGATTLVVEAIDHQCPFPGAYGNASVVVPVPDAPTGATTFPATINGQVVQMRRWPKTFPIRTEAEIRAQYKSMILNGHGPAAPPGNIGSSVDASPFINIGQPAAPIAPKVLARTFVQVTPSGTASLPSGFTANDVFDDFSDESDQPKLVKAQKNGEGLITPPGWLVVGAKLYQNSKWNFYTYSANPSQFFLAQGQVHMLLADEGQQDFSSNVMYPRRAMHLPDDDAAFLHTTYEVQTDATQRRYWAFHACGAAVAGQTFKDGELAPQSGIAMSPAFMNPTEAYPISTQGWNCFELVPRGGSYEVMEGGTLINPKLKMGRPETDIRTIVTRPTPAGVNPAKDLDSVLLMGPAQGVYKGDQKLEGAWYRTMDASQKLTGVLLDDQMFITQRTRFDVFLNRGRVVVFINGVQKICNDFPAANRLTMAEAAVGIGQVLYHSNVEREDFVAPDWNRTAQYYYRYNTPFIDTRSLDNVGMRENAALPTAFDATRCYKP